MKMKHSLWSQSFYSVLTQPLTYIHAIEGITLTLGWLKVVNLVVDLQSPDASDKSGIRVQEVSSVAKGSGAAQDDGLGKGDPGKESLGSSLLMDAVIELKPHAPVVAVDRDLVPSVKVHLLLSPDHARSGATIKSESVETRSVMALSGRKLENSIQR